MATASATPLTSIFASSRTSTPKLPSLTSCNINTHQISNQQNSISRRDLFKGLALVPLVLTPPPSIAREVEVGSYLPPSPSNPSFVVFQATPKDTPALRAGNLITGFNYVNCPLYYDQLGC